MLNNYPNHWLDISLQDLAKFIDYRGKTPTKTNEGIPLITAKNIRNGYIDREPREYIATQDYVDWMTRGFPQYGDVLITTEAPLGNVAQIDIKEKFALAQRAICLQPYLSGAERYFYYFLRSNEFQLSLLQNATGTTVKGIKASILKNMTLKIPPLAEQQQIAQRLDELLAQVDTIKARLDAIPAILKRFRQSVLSAAVSGKLTEEWRKLNPQELWQECELKLLDISLQIGPFGSLLHKSDYIKDGVPLINPMHINNGRIYPSSHMTISHEKALELKRYGLNVGDVILGRRGEMGRAAVVYNQNYICGTGSLFLRANSERFNSNFISLFFRSPQTIKKLEADAVGSTMVNLNQKVLQTLIFPNISIIEQIEIVRRVDQFSTFAEQIEQRVNDAKARVDKLTQSILAKAFRGELTADWRAEHPELISGENSAEALLAKIQTAKAALEGKKKKGKAA